MGDTKTRKLLRVAITGARGNLGQLLLPLLQDDPRVESVQVIDLEPPEQRHPKQAFHRVDLAVPEAEAVLTELFLRERVDVVYHLAFLLGSGNTPAFAHELEVMGTLQVLSSVSAAKVRRLVVPSVTAVYGARGQHPAFIPEDATLGGCRHSRFIQDRVVVEEQVRAFRKSHPDTQIVVLRFAPLVGPTTDNPFVRFLQPAFVPTLLGFDPLFQVVHEEDAAQALHLALDAGVGGEFNIVSDGVISLSGLVRQAGKRPLPLPEPVARAAVRTLNFVGAFSVAPSLLSYLHFSWIADGGRAVAGLGFTPRHHARDAIKTLQGN
jgi:UDP-glucose 4-epimerase